MCSGVDNMITVKVFVELMLLMIMCELRRCNLIMGWWSALFSHYCINVVITVLVSRAVTAVVKYSNRTFTNIERNKLMFYHLKTS